MWLPPGLGLLLSAVAGVAVSPVASAAATAATASARRMRMVFSPLVDCIQVAEE
jgi:hypothetical protein